MEFDVVIPARYGSRRLPGKPLIDIRGKPLIQHVYESACGSSAANVFVATDDERIVDAVHGFGGRAILTGAEHCSGTDRIAEAVGALGLSDDRVVVNVQGDEPRLPGSLIDGVAEALVRQPRSMMSTACHPIEDELERKDPNVVKVVTDAEGLAIYFSRSPIPFSRAVRGVHTQRHIGIYGYRVHSLNTFTRWEICDLERAEGLEQLRVLYYGGRIVVIPSPTVPGTGVDTGEDLIKFRKSLDTS